MRIGGIGIDDRVLRRSNLTAERVRDSTALHKLGSDDVSHLESCKEQGANL